jgi:D-alanyl-D-alanine carboxypeptidase
MITEKTLMGLVSGEQITIEHLLYGALVESGNDAAYALAEHDSSGVDGFVAKMNAKASSLFLSHTHYQNPIGFDDPAQYTTARDLARLTRIALHNDEINKIVGTVSITVPDITYSIFHPLKNVNQLLGKVAGVTGFKTGTTASAGECLVTTVQRKGHKIIVVVLKSTDRFGESEALINWVYNNFQWQPVGAAA